MLELGHRSSAFRHENVLMSFQGWVLKAHLILSIQRDPNSKDVTWIHEIYGSIFL